MKQRGADAAIEQVVKAMAERQEAMEREMSALTSAVRALEARVAEWSAQQAAGRHGVTLGSLAANAENAAPARTEGLKPKIAAAIAAAATVVAGRGAKVRSVRTIAPAQDAGSAWSQQGRVGVLTSHNLR